MCGAGLGAASSEDENQKSTYSIRGHAADPVSDDEAEEEKASQ